MWITNCQIILKDRIEKGTVRVREGKITRIILEDKTQNEHKENLKVNLNIDIFYKVIHLIKMHLFMNIMQ